MATIVNTGTDNIAKLDATQIYQVYNALDCCVTDEVLDALLPQLTPETRRVYDFERALQGPVLEMQLRGVKVDEGRRQLWIDELRRRLERLDTIINRYAYAVWDAPLNPNSPQKVKDFFYKAMKIPAVESFKKGERKLSSDREALEKIGGYFRAQPIVNAILAARDTQKKLGVLLSGTDKDGRMRASYNIAGTETGRFSSSANAFGTGTNFQNITDELRRIFVAPVGRKLAYIDLEQAESRLVGLLSLAASRKTSYLDACEGGDLHTTVARMVWPNLAWTGDLKHDKKQVAGQLFYRDFSYRDMAKRGGHGTNYYGQPFTMARHLHVERPIMEEFQAKYFRSFPEIRQWHYHVARTLQTKGVMFTVTGRRRQFFGRRDDYSTLREAIAFGPQSAIADIMNFGMWRLWRETQPGRPLHGVHILAQVHDAVLIEFDESEEDQVIPQARALLQPTLSIYGREFSIPTDAETGWNWSHFDYNDSTRNPDGMKGFTGHDERKRQELPVDNILDRVIS